MLIATFIQYERGGFHSYVAESCAEMESEFNSGTSRDLTDAISELLKRYGARAKVKRSARGAVARARAIPE
jgi:hypothetical protein